jgi:hypothetical protein
MTKFYSWTPRRLRPVLPLLVVGSLCHSARAQTPTFAAVAEYSTGTASYPNGIVVADVNGDGRLDILTANYDGNTVGVLLGTEAGTFGAVAPFNTGANSQPTNLAVGDVNGDGKLDILTANSGSNTVGVLLGTGTGTFGAVTTFSTGTNSYPNDIAIGDINGDGKLDILTANYISGSVGVLLGIGTGTFGAVATLSTGDGRSPDGIVVADVNGDSKLDILTANSISNTVGVLLGTGAGTFGAATTFNTGTDSRPTHLAMADVNGDSKLDILTANSGSSSVGVLLGTGAGTFGAVATFSTGTSNFPYGIAVGDVNGDGKLDVLTANNYSNTGGVLLGTGAGIFGAAITFNTGRGSSPIDVAVGDANGDGQLDVFITYGNNIAGVLLNTTHPTTIPPTVTAATRCGSGSVTLQASGAGAGGAYRWYPVATGGTAISGATGSTYTTPTLYGTTTYYVSVVDASGANESTRTPVTATVSYSLTPTIVASGATTLNAGSSVTLTARPNLALQFDGTSQYVTTTLDAQPAALPTTTWEAWVYPTRTNFGARQTLFSVDDGAYDRGVDIEANTASYVVFTGTGTWAPTTVDLNTWQHIAVVYTPTGISFYKNGVEYVYNTSNGFSVNPTTNKFQIARNPGFNEPFQGQLDEVRVWNYQRTQAQIQAGMFAVPAGTTTGLVGLWRFNEGSGTWAADATSNYPGTLISSPAYVAPGQTSLSTLAYTWAPTTDLSGSTTPAVTAMPSASTTYTVTVTDNSGCPQTASQLVTVVGADLVISTPGQTIAAGTYNSITINNGGVATLAGNVSVNGLITVNDGGTLNDGCALLSGAGSFTLAPGGTLGICNVGGITASGSTGAVQVTGARFFSSDASYVYNGGDSQVTGSGLPSQVRTLSTTTNSPVRLSNPVEINQVLTVGGAGNLDLNGQALTLLSSSAGTALVVNAGAGRVVGNTVVVQRYIDGSLNSGAGYRHYSVPVTGTTVADFATSDFSPLVNPAYNSSATPGTVRPFPNFYLYNQNRLASASNNLSTFDKGWFSPSDLNYLLYPGFGYTVNIDAGQVVDLVGGLVSTPSTTIFLERTTGATAADGGWVLLGNPYASPLDLSLVAAADRRNVDAATYVIQSTGQYAGGYRAYVNGVSTSASNSPLLALGQGFFVRVSAGQASGTFTFRNAQRVTTYASQAAFQRPTADARPTVRLELAGAGRIDAWVAYAEAGATPAFDGAFDADKLPNTTGLNLSSVAGPNNLAIDGRADFTTATTLLLAVGVPAAGTYTFTAAALDNLPTGLTAYLRDAQTGQTTKLTVGTSYGFRVSAAEAQALIVSRFTVVFNPQMALATTPALSAEAVSVHPNPAHSSFAVTLPGIAGAKVVQAELVNTLGQVVRHQSAALPASGTSFRVPTAELAAGVYVLRLQAGNTTLTKRVVVQ